MSELTRKQIAQLATKTKLLTPQQVQDGLDEMGNSDLDPEPLLEFFLRRGWITPLQQDKLLKGDTAGYFMGSYRLLYKIHSGSFGRVYRADDPSSGRVVAIKVLRKRWSDKPEIIELFEREGRVGMKLHHPNIVEILNIGKDAVRGEYYIVMEFVEGANLRDILQIRKKFNTLDGMKIMEDIASALAYATAKGITHRDIKLTNVLISSQGTAKVVDYGLAQISSKYVGEEDNTGVARTCDYAGLERATGADFGDVRSDIFFCGCVAYEILTGRSPLTMTRIKHERMARDRFMSIPPIEFSEIEGQGSMAAIRMVQKAMELDPMLRYQTAAQFLEAIKQVKAEAGGEIGAVNPSVFIVENDERLQDVMREKFRKMGYKVLIAGNPSRAMERYFTAPYQILIVDVGTAGEEGTGVINKINIRARSNGETLHTIAIFNEEQKGLENLIEPDFPVHKMHRPIKMHDLIMKLQQLAPATPPEAVANAKKKQLADIDFH